jgi:hypothetical protein
MLAHRKHLKSRQLCLGRQAQPEAAAAAAAAALTRHCCWQWHHQSRKGCLLQVGWQVCGQLLLLHAAFWLCVASWLTSHCQVSSLLVSAPNS